MFQNINNVIPIKSYLKASELKAIIFKENKNKCGIYKWTNKINNKSYIGSSVKLNRRLSDYYSLNVKNINYRSDIKDAILKYKLSNFNLDILEYCEPAILIKREQYYIDNMKPEYNILKIAGSLLGHKLSEETRLKLSKLNIGNKNPMYGKYHSEETLKKLMELYKNKKKITLEVKNWRSLTNKGIIIQVYDNSNNLVNKFFSIKETAEHFKVDIRFISKYINNNKQYKGFTFKPEIKDNRVGIYDPKNKLIEVLVML